MTTPADPQSVPLPLTVVCAWRVAHDLASIKIVLQGYSTRVVVIGFPLITEMQGPFPESVSRAVNRLQQTLIFRAFCWSVKEVDLCRFALLRNMDADTDESYGFVV